MKKIIALDMTNGITYIGQSTKSHGWYKLINYTQIKTPITKKTSETSNELTVEDATKMYRLAKDALILKPGPKELNMDQIIGREEIPNDRLNKVFSY